MPPRRTQAAKRTRTRSKLSGDETSERCGWQETHSQEPGGIRRTHPPLTHIIPSANPRLRICTRTPASCSFCAVAMQENTAFFGHETAFWHGFRPCSCRKRCCGRQNPRSENLKASKMRRNRPSACQNAVSWPKSEGFATWKPVPLRRQNENAHRCTGESTKRENGDVENASGWAARIRTLIAGTKNQSPAVGRRPSEQIEAHNDERKWWAVRESNPRPWD